MQLARIIQLPDHLTTREKIEFLSDIIVYLHDCLEESESVPVQRAFGFIGTTGALAAAWSICGLGMVAPVVAIPGVIIVVGCSIASGVTLAKDVIESPEIIDLQKRFVTVLESKEIDQWAKLWDEVGTESFLRRLQYSCMGSFKGKDMFRHKSGSHPFDVAVLFGGRKQVTPWEKIQQPKNEQNTRLDTIDATTSEVQPMPINYQQVVERPASVSQTQATPARSVRSAFTLILDNPLECRAIFGFQRTGKSYLLAVTSQELCRQGTKIYHINLGSYGTEEDVYWGHCVRSVRGDISSMRAYEAGQLIEQAIAVVDEFYSQEDAILIFDEWVYVGKKNNAHIKALQPLVDLVADRAGILTQTGVKRSKAIWTVAPEFVAANLVDSAKVIKSFSLVYVTIAPGRSIQWTNPRTGKSKPVKFSTQLFDQVSNNYEIEMPTERFTVDRICFIDDEWIEVGDLPPLDPTLRPVVTSIATTPPPLPDARQSYTDEEKQQAEAIAPTEPTVELKISDDLGEPLKSIWLFTKEQQGWVSVRDLQRKNFAVLKGKSSEQIHQYLGLLADTGYGQIDEQGKSHSSVAFLAH